MVIQARRCAVLGIDYLKIARMRHLLLDYHGNIATPEFQRLLASEFDVPVFNSPR
jgi:hypothetical protein